MQKFDPSDPEHQSASLSLLIRGRLHPTLRFDLDFPFTSAPSMMAMVLALKQCETVLVKNYGLTVDSALQLMAGDEGRAHSQHYEFESDRIG